MGLFLSESAFLILFFSEGVLERPDVLKLQLFRKLFEPGISRTLLLRRTNSFTQGTRA